MFRGKVGEKKLTKELEKKWKERKEERGDGHLIRCHIPWKTLLFSFFTRQAQRMYFLFENKKGEDK